MSKDKVAKTIIILVVLAMLMPVVSVVLSFL